MKSTVSPFEQFVALVSGTLSAGPLGGLAAWGAIRALEGKWIPWLVLGISTTPFLLLVQILTFANLFNLTTPPIIIEQREEMLYSPSPSNSIPFT